jgi:hypothetical protein
LETKVAQRFFLFIVGLHLYYRSLYIECYRMFDCSISWYLWGCAIFNDGLRSQYVLYIVCNRFWYEVRTKMLLQSVTCSKIGCKFMVIIINGYLSSIFSITYKFVFSISLRGTIYCLPRHY